MSMRSKWQNIDARDWNFIRDAWVDFPISVTSPNESPQPGLENLEGLRQITIKQQPLVFPDVAGLRINALSEAIFLYKKCCRSRRASQALAASGCHSWALFNAYHSAYLGARGTMALLGFAIPNIAGNQVGIDFFPITDYGGSQGKRPKVVSKQDFRIFSLSKLEQRYIWEALKHVTKIAKVECWDSSLLQEVDNLNYEQITPPRNYFLYKATYWPLGDLLNDATTKELETLIGTSLDVDQQGFLLRLCFTIFQLFESLVADLAQYSNSVAWHVAAVNHLLDCNEWSPYPEFIEQVRTMSANVQVGN